MDAKLLEALKIVIGLANTQVEDIQSGIEGRIYEAEQNPDIDRDAEAVRLLEEFVDSGKAEEIPVVVVHVDGSINCVNSTVPVRVVGMDFDTESGSPENIITVFDSKMYVTDQTVTTYGDKGGDGVQPDYVERVLTYVD